MKILLSLCLFFCLLMADQGLLAPQSTCTWNLHCDCGNYTMKTLSYIKTLVSEMKTMKGLVSYTFLKNATSEHKNCAELLKAGFTESGVYFIDPDGKGPLKVYCDQVTNGGGWAVFQRRKDGSEDFYRKWNDYKDGFGDLAGEFWLGLDDMYRLSNQTRNRLRIELEDIRGKRTYAEYSYFSVASEKHKYKLSLGAYSGTTAYNSMSEQQGSYFSTKDYDNDGDNPENCAVENQCGWWLYQCTLDSNLNGVYYKKGPHPTPLKKTLAWYDPFYKTFGKMIIMRFSEMKIRPV